MDLLEKVLITEKYQYLRMDGKTHGGERQGLSLSFSHSPFLSVLTSFFSRCFFSFSLPLFFFLLLSLSSSAIVDAFSRVEEKFVFLLSTKVGGVGLNLCSANVVIIFDCNW